MPMVGTPYAVLLFSISVYITNVGQEFPRSDEKGHHGGA